MKTYKTKCKECGKRGKVALEDARELVVCNSCGGEVYKKIGMERSDYIFAMLGLNLLSSSILSVPTSGVILTFIALIFIQVYITMRRAKNIGDHPAMALLAIIPFLWLYFAFARQQSALPKKK